MSAIVACGISTLPRHGTTRLATRIPTVRFAAVVLSPTRRIIHPADGNECAVARLVAATKRDPSRPAGCSESVAGTRSFSRQGGHFHEALNPQHARPERRAETNRSSRCPRSRSTYRRESRVLASSSAHSQVVSPERREASPLYCQWFSYLTCRLSVPQYA